MSIINKNIELLLFSSLVSLLLPPFKQSLSIPSSSSSHLLQLPLSSLMLPSSPPVLPPATPVLPPAAPLLIPSSTPLLSPSPFMLPEPILVDELLIDMPPFMLPPAYLFNGDAEIFSLL